MGGAQLLPLKEYPFAINGLQAKTQINICIFVALSKSLMLIYTVITENSKNWDTYNTVVAFRKVTIWIYTPAPK